MKDLLSRVIKEEISFSRMVEMLNEKAQKPESADKIDGLFRPALCPFSECPHTFMYCLTGKCPSSSEVPSGGVDTTSF